MLMESGEVLWEIEKIGGEGTSNLPLRLYHKFPRAERDPSPKPKKKKGPGPRDVITLDHQGSGEDVLQTYNCSSGAKKHH